MIDVASLGEDLPLLGGLRTTRAIRRLRPDPVPLALVQKVCEAGTFAPSGGNRQPWKFVAVLDAERRRWIAERYRKAFHAYIAAAVEAATSPDFPEAGRRNQRAAIHLADHLHEAPVLLFVAGWTRRGEPQLQALMPAVQNVLLACRAVGLGASLTTLHRSFGEECDRFLGLPEGCPSCALLPIGWPLGRYGRPPRRPIDECFFLDRYASEARSEAKPSGGGGPEARSEAKPSGGGGPEARSEAKPSGGRGPEARSEAKPSGGRGPEARSEAKPSGGGGPEARSEA